MGAEGDSDAPWAAYNRLIEFLFSLELDLSYDKCLDPRTELTWIGVTFNTVNLTMKICEQKVEEVCDIIKSWLKFNVKRTGKEIDSLVGKLFRVIKCGKPARPFLCRLQDL